MNLKERLDAAITAARKALDEGNLDEAKKQREVAEGMKAQIEEAKALDGLSQVAYEPVRPVLPGAGDGSLPASKAVDAKDAGEGETLVSGAYHQRFGNVESEVKSILTDLHGSDYIQKYWGQRKAFRKYLVHGETALNRDEQRILREVVMTPGAVKSALIEGIDELTSLKTTLIEASDILGGYFVPVDIQSRMIELIEGMTVIRPRAAKITTQRDRVEMASALDNGGDTTNRYTSPVRTAWVDSTPAALTTQSLSFGMIGIPVHTSMTEAFIGNNLLEDSAFNLESYLAKKLSESVAIDEDDQFLVGDGVGKPQGILPGGVNLSTRIPEVAIGSSSPYVGWDALIDVTFKIPRQYRRTSIWLGRKATYNAIRKLRDATSGAYLWTPFQYEGGNQNVDAPAQLLGYAVEEGEGMPALASNAYAILYGDLSAYQIVDRVGMTLQRFSDSALARQNVTSFIMRRRLGGQLLEPHRLVAGKCA